MKYLPITAYFFAEACSAFFVLNCMMFGFDFVWESVIAFVT